MSTVLGDALPAHQESVKCACADSLSTLQASNASVSANDFLNRAVNCFNYLPVHVIDYPNIHSFKNALCSIDLSDFIKCVYVK